MSHGYFYKNKFLIAIYNENDKLVAIYDNANDMALRAKRSLTAIQYLISSHIRNKHKVLWWNKERCQLYLIELSDEDKEEILKGGVSHDQEYQTTI